MQSKLALLALAASIAFSNGSTAQEQLIIAPAATAVSAADNSAAMMLLGHHSRSVWELFPGFTADIVVSTDSTSHAGKLAVSHDFDFELSIDGSAKLGWVESKLRSVLSHRKPNDAPAYDVTFVDEVGSHPSGRLIAHKDGSGTFRIHDGLIHEVHRKSDSTWIEITNVEQLKTHDGRYLPETTSVTYRDPKTGDLLSNGSNRFTWKRVCDFYLPESTFTVEVGKNGARTVQKWERAASGSDLIFGFQSKFPFDLLALLS